MSYCEFYRGERELNQDLHLTDWSCFTGYLESRFTTKVNDLNQNSFMSSNS